MNHWWRAYNEAVNDPKLQLISDSLFRAWFNLMCVASGNDGRLPAVNSLAFTLRMKPEKVMQVLTQLNGVGLLDKTDDGFTPHNWNGRQYKSDVSTERVKRFRETKRNVSSAVPETPPETETETEQKEQGAGASCAIAPTYQDSRHELWGEGVPILVSLGEKESRSRQMIGTWLKQTSDDAAAVLSAIQRARDKRVHGPIAWITRALGNGNGNSVSGYRTDPVAGRATAREAQHVASVGDAALQYLRQSKPAGSDRETSRDFGFASVAYADR